jgi:hypothetical protein
MSQQETIATSRQGDASDFQPPDHSKSAPLNVPRHTPDIRVFPYLENGAARRGFWGSHPLVLESALFIALQTQAHNAPMVQRFVRFDVLKRLTNISFPLRGW